MHEKCRTTKEERHLLDQVITIRVTPEMYEELERLARKLKLRYIDILRNAISLGLLVIDKQSNE